MVTEEDNTPDRRDFRGWTPPDYGDKLRPARRAAGYYSRRLVQEHRAFSTADLDDTCQELVIAIWQQLDRFDPERSSLATYADRICLGRTVSLIRDREAAKRDWRRNGPSLNERGRWNIDEKETLEEFSATLPADSVRAHRQVETASDQEALERALDVPKVVERLPRLLKQVAKLLAHLPQNAVAQELGLSRRELDTAMEKILSVFRDAELDAYL